MDVLVVGVGIKVGMAVVGDRLVYKIVDLFDGMVSVDTSKPSLDTPSKEVLVDDVDLLENGFKEISECNRETVPDAIFNDDAFNCIINAVKLLEVDTDDLKLLLWVLCCSVVFEGLISEKNMEVLQ